MEKHPIKMHDNVRVLTTEITQSMRVAGLIGNVYGITTPSQTGIEAVGGSDSDCAINVYFEERKEDIWFNPDLLEFVDYAVGKEITVGGIKLARLETGEWQEVLSGNKYKNWWEPVVKIEVISKRQKRENFFKTIKRYFSNIFRF